jgi:hypothetical protein
MTLQTGTLPIPRQISASRKQGSGSYPGACGRCDLRWDSPTQAHCRMCPGCSHFSCVSAFDAHLPLDDHGDGPPKPCRDPGSLRDANGAPLLILVHDVANAGGPMWRYAKPWSPQAGS